MERQSVLNADYLDIIFDKRNKQYGGYELRKHYSGRLGKALLTMVFLCASLSAYTLYAMTPDPADAITDKPEGTMTVVNITPPPQPPAPPAPPAHKPPADPAPAAIAPTVANTVPKIVKDPEALENELRPLEDIKDKQPGLYDNDGDPNGKNPDHGQKSGDGEGFPELPGRPPAPPAPVAWVEQMPEFNGDMNGFLAKHLQYPAQARENGIEGKVVIRFVVNEDGSVSNAEVVKGIGGGCVQEALRVVQMMPKWKPGKQNGRAVKVYFTLPVAFLLH